MFISYCGIPKDESARRQAAQYYQDAGVTSIQTYIFWNTIEKEPGVYDWSRVLHEVHTSCLSSKTFPGFFACI